MSWWAAPVHADEETGRVARAIRILGLCGMFAVVPALVHNAAAGVWYSALALACEEILLLAGLVLNHCGRVRLAARLMTFSAIALAASLQLTSGQGVHDVAILLYPCAIVVAGALFDRRWFLFFTLLAMASLATLTMLELTGVVSYPLSHYTELRLLVDSEIILALCALLVGLVTASLRSSMLRLRDTAVSLRESEALNRSLFESVNEAILVYAPQPGRIVDATPRVSEWFGYSAAELRELSLGQLGCSNAPFTEALRAAQANGADPAPSELVEWQARRRDGTCFWVEVSRRAALVRGQRRVLISLREIDERKRAADEKRRLEEQLRQAQRLESIGRLAGGVAHDFNNLLTSILGNVEMSTSLVPAHHPVSENLSEIRHAGRRAAELTSQLLAFSRKQPIAPVPIDLKNVLASVDRLLRRLLGETIAMQCEIADDIGRIHADPGQVEQVLVNLAVNARDAMPNGGQLTLLAANAELDDGFCARHANARPGPFVRLGMRDTGTGMSEETQQHIFEPFFTTKAPGKGTGLGLAMVFGAVEQSRGFIVVDSAVGRGTTFDLYFPRFFGELAPKVVPEKRTSLPPGTERILLVEDDELVRHLSQRVLGHLGYQVTVCATGADAITTSRDRDRGFDLLMTDLILPDMDGRALAQRLCDLQPGLRVLCCSGYAEESAEGPSNMAFLAKPFSAQDLAVKIRAVLDETTA
jgi:two-component system, cell cycle sensor histidine kinase and response regulator CckA